MAKSSSPQQFALLAAVLAAGVTVFATAAVQQNYRQSANDPQIQLARDGADALGRSLIPSAIVGDDPQIDAGSSLAPGLLAVIVDTVIYFAIGWLIGAVHGLLFNAATSWMGGIVVEREEERYREAAPAPRMQSSRRAEPTFGETIRRRDVDE